MALHFKTISYKENEFRKRIDPKFYHLQEEMMEFKSNDSVSMCDFGKIILGITDGEHAGQTFVKKGVLFLKNSSIKDFDISLNDGFFISEEKHKRLSRSAVKPEDILFTTIGHLGSAAIVPENFCEANMNQNFVKINIDSKKINPYYVACFLNSKFARRQVKALLTGNIQSILTYPKIRSIKIVYPTNIDEQISIAEKYKESLYLSQQAEKFIGKSLQLFEDNLNISLNKKDCSKIFSVSFDDFYSNSIWTTKSHLPEYVNTEKEIISQHECVDLGKIATVKKGDEPGSDSYSDYLDKADNDVPFVRTSDIYNYQIDLSPDNFVDIGTYRELAQDVHPGDILFTKDGKIAEAAMVTKSDKAVYQSGITIIRINDIGIKMGITQEYLFTAIICNKIGRYTAERYTVTASTIPHLKEHYIRGIKIPVFNKSIIDEITLNITKAFDCIERKKVLIQSCKNTINAITSPYFN